MSEKKRIERIASIITPDDKPIIKTHEGDNYSIHYKKADGSYCGGVRFKGCLSDRDVRLRVLHAITHRDYIDGNIE